MVRQKDLLDDEEPNQYADSGAAAADGQVAPADEENVPTTPEYAGTRQRGDADIQSTGPSDLEESSSEELSESSEAAQRQAGAK